MLTSKNELVSTYGHFYALFAAHAQKEKADYEGLIGTNQTYETYWDTKSITSTPPKNFVIREFLGVTDWGQKATFTETEGSAQHGLNVFRTPDEALKRVDQIMSQINKQQPNVRVPIIQRDLSDQIKFPRIVRDGDQAFCFKADVVNYRLKISEATIVKPNLRSRYDKYFTLDFAMRVQCANEKATVYSDGYRLESTPPADNKPLKWNFRDNSVDNAMYFHPTREGIEEIARKVAAQTARNLQGWLPPVPNSAVA